MAGRRAPARALAAAGALAAALGLGCGGGSATDLVLPQDVEVTFDGPQSRAPGSVALELASASGRDFAIQVLAVGVEAATGVAFDLAYDPAVLQFVGTDPGTFFGPAAVSHAATVENEPGRIVGVSAAENQAEGRSGSGPLLTLRFRLQQLRDAESPLSFRQPESQVYEAAGFSAEQGFAGARVVTRIRAPQ